MDGPPHSKSYSFVRPGDQGSILGGGKERLSSSLCVQIGSGTQPASCPIMLDFELCELCLAIYKLFTASGCVWFILQSFFLVTRLHGFDDKWTIMTWKGFGRKQ
jgi:hypothetical protein